MFVVVITEQEQAFVAPRAVGPFEDYDTAQAFGRTLTDQWAAEGRTVPNAAVTRIEEPFPGVVVGEL